MRDLAALRLQGEHPVQVLNKSIANVWTGVFPLRRASDRPSQPVLVSLTSSINAVAEQRRQQEEALAKQAQEDAAERQNAQQGLELCHA